MLRTFSPVVGILLLSGVASAALQAPALSPAETLASSIASVPLNARAADSTGESGSHLLVATLLRYTETGERIVFSFTPDALAGAATSLTIRYANESGARVQLSIPMPTTRELEWSLPFDLKLGAPDALSISLDGAKSWLKLSEK